MQLHLYEIICLGYLEYGIHRKNRFYQLSPIQLFTDHMHYTLIINTMNFFRGIVIKTEEKKAIHESDNLTDRITDRRIRPDRRNNITDRRIRADRRNRITDFRTDNSTERRIQLDRRCGLKDRRILPDRRYRINDLITNFRMRYIKGTRAKRK